MTVNYSDAINFARNYKKTSKVPIIIGGVHISTLPISMNSSFDIGVMGEGEETFSELVSLYIKKQQFTEKDIMKIKNIVLIKDNKILTTEKREPLKLDTLPFPDFKFVNNQYFDLHERSGISVKRAFVLTSRSCPYKCKFQFSRSFRH